MAADPFAIEQCPIGFIGSTLLRHARLYKIAEPILADPSVPPSADPRALTHPHHQQCPLAHRLFPNVCETVKQT